MPRHPLTYLFHNISFGFLPQPFALINQGKMYVFLHLQCVDAL
ncbi:hypothetical protein COPEUT_00740 [Coprococcus eutactus ATCC 27759]|nr:hypothetical protein COPEUT_00740 [Coprococcus eutactus ATCC 27759]